MQNWFCIERGIERCIDWGIDRVSYISQSIALKSIDRVSIEVSIEVSIGVSIGVSIENVQTYGIINIRKPLNPTADRTTKV